MPELAPGGAGAVDSGSVLVPIDQNGWKIIQAAFTDSQGLRYVFQTCPDCFNDAMY